MGMLSAKEAADAWGLTPEQVLALCEAGRVPGARMTGASAWEIPDGAPKPEGAQAQALLPLRQSVRAEGHTPQYKMHKYFARRPYNVFQHLLKHYTKKGDIVLDAFCGGGVTVFEGAALARRVIGVDLNPLAAFITRMQMFHGDTGELEAFYRRFLLMAEKKYRDWYQVVFPDDRGTALWFEWVYVVRCPRCGGEILLLEDRKKANGIYLCSNPYCPGHSEGVKRVECRPAGSRPLRVKYRSDRTGDVLVRPLSLENMPAFQAYDFQALADSLPCHPDFPIPDDWDRRYEDKLKEKGILRYRDFFTPRNYALSCLLFQDILQLREAADSALNEYLYFLFSSALRYTNKMTRVTENWEGGKPTAMDKHAFWLPNQYVETNILEVLQTRAKTILRGCAYAASRLPGHLREASGFEDLRRGAGYLVLNQSAASLPIPDEAVDAMITDPPYGSNVQYAELSSIWTVWLARYQGLEHYIYKDQEAVVNRKTGFPGAKTVQNYEDLLYQVFSEGARVLKPQGYLVFTFHNKNIKVWIAMLKAVARAGFYLPEDGILFQDYIDSYKNTAHLRFSGNIQGDFIYSFRKGRLEVPLERPLPFSQIIDSAVDRTVSALFRRRKTCSTPELYQKILAAMTRDLMATILWCTNHDARLEEIPALSNDYLEARLKASLVCQDGQWRKR